MFKGRLVGILLFAMSLAGGMLAFEAPATVTFQENALEQIPGTWIITSVYKDGKADPTHIGGTLTFTANTVAFKPAKNKTFASIG
jgi:hypothetical protein